MVDGHKMFVGSMNFDPRSVNINTEMGVLIESTTLGLELAGLVNRDMEAENAWQVRQDEQGKLIWVNSDEALTRQPARNVWQRFMDAFFKFFPKSQF